MTSKRICPVLQAEDEEHDVFFLKRAFAIAEIANYLVSVPDGQETIDYLKGAGVYADREQYPEPCLLLLDLKMPLVGGFEVLEWIRQQPRWRDSLPILVLSSSFHDSDRKKAFELGAQEYLVKPNEFGQLVALVRDLKRRWLDPLATGQPPLTGVHPETQPS